MTTTTHERLKIRVRSLTRLPKKEMTNIRNIMMTPLPCTVYLKVSPIFWFWKSHSH